jgi:hypothetical protein
MDTRQEPIKNEREREPSDEGDRDRRHWEMRVSRRTLWFGSFYDGFYAPVVFALRVEITERIKETHSGMMTPNPRPRSSPNAVEGPVAG